MLGVSKETLRNWDRAGKLKSKRNPANNYRTYALDDVLRLKEDSPVPPIVATAPAAKPSATKRAGGMTEELFKRHLARLHRSMRDAHGDSSLVGRFDEISKLLFAKALSEKTPGKHEFFSQLLEENEAYAARIRAFYETACAKFHALRIGQHVHRHPSQSEKARAWTDVLCQVRTSRAQAERRAGYDL